MSIKGPSIFEVGPAPKHKVGDRVWVGRAADPDCIECLEPMKATVIEIIDWERHPNRTEYWVEVDAHYKPSNEVWTYRRSGYALVPVTALDELAECGQ